jgi:hypothetical protein
MLLVVELRGKSKGGNIVNIASIGSIGSTANTGIWVAHHRPGSHDQWMIREGVDGDQGVFPLVEKVGQQWRKSWKARTTDTGYECNENEWNGRHMIFSLYFSAGKRLESLAAFGVFSMSIEGFQPHGGKQSIIFMSIFEPYSDPTSKTHIQTDGSERLLIDWNQMDNRVDRYVMRHDMREISALKPQPHVLIFHHNKPTKPSQQPSQQTLFFNLQPKG